MEREADIAAGNDQAAEFAVDRRWAEFASRDSELAFLDSVATSELNDFRRAMLICGPLYLAFIVSDYLQVKDHPAIWVILAARSVVCLLALGFGLRFGRHGKQNGETVAAAYLASRIFFAAAIVLALVIFPLSGRSYVALYPALIVMMMAGFFFIPARFIDRFFASVFGIVGFNLEAMVWMPAPIRELPLALLLMLATLLLGAVIARSNALLRRQHYLDTLQQQRLNARLEKEAASRLRLQQEAMALANTDSLTGIANRRYFFLLAEKELSRARRYGGPLAAMILDVDHFKVVNDSHGHAIGDLALTTVAGTCRAVLRTSDLLGRIGGEEFAMLLPQTDSAGATSLAERLRQAIADMRVEYPTGSLSLSVTIGVAVWQGGADSLDQLLRRADDMLYEGKRQGRNRVSVAGI